MARILARFSLSLLFFSSSILKNVSGREGEATLDLSLEEIVNLFRMLYKKSE